MSHTTRDVTYVTLYFKNGVHTSTFPSKARTCSVQKKPAMNTKYKHTLVCTLHANYNRVNAYYMRVIKGRKSA